MSDLNRMKIIQTGDQIIEISAAIIMTEIGFSGSYTKHSNNIKLKTLLKAPFIRTVSYKSRLASSVTI